MSRKKHTSRNRRSYLKTIGAVGAIGLAGCMGGNGDGDTGNGEGETLVLSTAAEATANFAMMQGVATVINENSDEVQLDVRPSEGMAANAGILARGNADLGLVPGDLAYQIQEGMGPFEDIDIEIRQVVHTASSDQFLLSHGGNFGSIDEIDSDTAASPGPSGSSIREFLDYALETVDIEYDERSIDFGEQGNALNEGQIDVGFGTFMNSNIDPTEPGWMEQIKGATTPDILDIPDDMWEALEEDPIVETLELEHDPDGYGEYPSTIRLLPQATFIVATDDVSDELIYEMLSTQYEHRDELEQYHDLAEYYETDEHWTSLAFENTPFHGGAADFYEEQDMWDDGFERP